MKSHKIVFDDVGHVTTSTCEEEFAALGPREVRFSPRYLGICGSDLHVLAGGHPFAQPPTVPGHEICGQVTEIGAEVTGVNVGDHVVVDPIMACGSCRACLAGRPNLCEPPNVAGFRAPGFGRSSHIVPARNVHVAPASIPWRMLAFTEPATCAVHSVSRMPEECREDVFVIGAGTIGLSIIRGLRISGAGRVTVSEPDPAKRELAVHLGADRCVAPGELDNETFTGVFDVVASQPTLTEACTRVAAGGTVVVMGVPSGPREIPLPSMQRFERTLTSSGMYVPNDFETAISWIASGEFDPSELVTDVFPFADAPSAYGRAQEADSIKVLIEFPSQNN